MKKLLFLTLLISIVSCQSKPDSNYADELHNCLTEIDVTLLNNATELFGIKLIEHYGNDNINQNYLSYLNDMSQVNNAPVFPKDFFLNDQSIQIIKDLEENGTSKKIWMAFVQDENDFEEEITITASNEDDEPKEAEFTIDVINPNGDYLQCMLKSNKNKTMTNTLKKMAELGALNPSLTAGALKENMKASDFENGLNKVAVAIGFYYDFANMINKSRK